MAGVTEMVRAKKGFEHEDGIVKTEAGTGGVRYQHTLTVHSPAVKKRRP